MAEQGGVLIVVETSAGELRDACLELVTAASESGASGPVTALVIGHAIDGVASDVAKLGVDQVLVVDNPAVERYTTQAYVAAIQAAIESASPDLVILAGTTSGRDLGPYLAALRGENALVDCTSLNWNGQTLSGVRPVYQGKMVTDVTVEASSPAFAVVRTGAFAEATAGDSTASIEPLQVTFDENQQVELVGLSQPKAGAAGLEDADIVVCGGRGLGDAENYAMVPELADVLGGAVGATRAVTDLGWRPHNEQIGQTGANVRPKLYIGIGVSGAVQHMVGMQNSETIVAINRDPDAPLFRIAEIGVVGDLNEIVPALIEAVKAAKAS